MNANEMVGQVVMVVGTRIFGIAEYVTPGGWVGIRQPGGRIDDYQVGRVIIDPT